MAAAAAASAKRPEKSELKVAAPLVVVTTKSGTVRNAYFGDVLGDDVTKESVDHLRDLGFVSDSSDNK